MAFRVGRTHFVEFRIVDLNSNPVATRVLADFQVLFTRDNVATTETLTLLNMGGGRYVVTYVPLSAGHYFLELYDAANDIRIQDEEEIDSPESFFASDGAITLTQDFGGIGALKPGVPKPDTYTLYVFPSQLWQTGQTDPSYAVAQTNLDASGNWITPSLPVVKGTYHVVIKSTTKTLVVSAFLKV